MAVTLEGTYRLVDRASPALRSIERRAQAADRALDKLGRTMDKMAARGAISKIDSLGKSLGNIDNQSGRVARSMDSVATSNRRMASSMDGSSKKTRTLTSDMGKFETAMRKVVIISAGLGKALAPAKIALIAVAIKPLIGAVSALGAGAVALVQQLGQATGAVVPLIARLGNLAGAGASLATVMLTVKASMLVTKFAFSGVTQAINGNKKALAGLTPQARAFVAEMKKLKPVLDAIRQTAQKGIFPGITAGIKTARANGAAQSANAAAGNIGGALGGLANSAAGQLTNPAVLKDLVALSGTAAVIITKLGGAALNLAQAFVSVLAAAQPLTRWIVNAAEGWSKFLLQQVQVARATGALSRYFATTRRDLQTLGTAARDFGAGFLNVMRVARGESGQFGTGIERIAKDFREWTDSFSNQARMALWFQRAQASAMRLGSILKSTLQIFLGIGRASDMLGRSMTTGIDKALGRWADWVNSFQGQNKLNAWFNGMRTTLTQLWGLVSDISVAFIKLGQGGGGAVGLIQSIRGLLPDLVKVINSFATNLGPGLIGTVTQLAHLLASLTVAGSSPLGLFLRATAGILANINGILDRFHAVRFAAATAISVIGGALLLQKLAKIAGGVGSIAAMWARVTGATVAATEAAGAYDAVAAAGGIGNAMNRNPGGSALPVIASQEARAASKGGRLRGLLRGGAGSIGLGVGLPVLAGVGAQLAQSNGVIGSRTASNISNVATLAGTGAVIGSVLPGPGTLIGAGVGAGAGLLMNSLSSQSGPSAAQQYYTSLSNTVKAHGFDISQPQGGAQNLAQANQYQRLLDQSRTRLLNRRNSVAPFGQLSKTAAAGAAKYGGAFGQAHTLDLQIAANQKLRAENIARLNVERANEKALKAQTAELRKQADIRAGRSAGAKLGAQYMGAYNVYRQGGMSIDAATARTVQNMLSRAKTIKNPAELKTLFAGGTDWLGQMKKQHPELAKEYKVWNDDMKTTMGKMGVIISTAGGKVLQVTTQQWVKIRQAMQNPMEQARQDISAKFTDMQQQARGMLIGLGYPASTATQIIQSMEAGGRGGAGPSARQVTAQGATPMPGGRVTRATGGRIPGQGLQDTVPIGNNAMAAPGELVVNRHTENRVNGMLGRMGTTLGAQVAGETRRHDDILPDISGYALGGRLGKAVAEANRIDSMHSRYQLGGGHVTPAPGTPPWDCSSATSRVLQAAGYNVPTMVASQYMNWGQPGKGAIGVAASKGHVYMMLNGKPWGTSYSNPGGGAGWIHNGTGWRSGFTQRHAPDPGGGAQGNIAGGRSAFPLIGPIDYSAFGSGYGGVPFAGMMKLGQVAASGMRNRINAKIGSMGAGGGGGGGGGGNMSQNETLARAMMLSAGWGGAEWSPLKSLWTRESGFSTTAKNPLSGAFGIPQSLPASKMRSAGSDYLTNPRTQIKWGLNYIKGRYGSPSAAWAHETASNWYARGGRVPSWGGWHAGGLDTTFDKPTVIGVGEKGRERVTVTPRSGGGGATSHTINIGPFHIQAGDDVTAIRRELDLAFEDLARMLDRQSTVGGN